MVADLNPEVIKYKIGAPIEDLLLVKQLLELSSELIMFGEFEIEPFTEFTLGFQAQYWYLKYYLLRDDKVTLENGEFSKIFEEKQINIIWLNIRNDGNFILECKDGVWYITIIGADNDLLSIFEKYKLIRCS